MKGKERRDWRRGRAEVDEEKEIEDYYREKADKKKRDGREEEGGRKIRYRQRDERGKSWKRQDKCNEMNKNKRRDGEKSK